MSKYGVISGPYFPAFGLNTGIYPINSVFSPNTGKYGPEITPYFGTFHAVTVTCYAIHDIDGDIFLSILYKGIGKK